MRKTQGDRSPFAISVVLNSYFKTHGEQSDIVIAFPGYMSKTRKNIQDFINSIRFPKNTYFTVGMNGNQSARPTTISIQNTHNTHIKFGFPVIGLKNTNKDHAKMIFILSNPANLNCIQANDLLTLDVKAALIGSSNQSFNTYFSKKADKGEADLLLINGDYLKHSNDHTSQDDEALRLFNVLKYPQEFEEFQTIKFKDKNMHNIALFKEFNHNTTLNLNELFKEAIRDLL